MIGLLRGLTAVSGLTVRELVRQRLWLVFVAVGAGFMAALPWMSAVDDTARRKLSVLAITSGLAFTAVLLAIMVGAQALRRDLDARTSFVLFSKPLRPITYLCGRWLGTQLWLLGGLIALSLAGSAALLLQFSSMPELRATREPTEWRQVSPVGEVTEIEATRDRFSLSGFAGNGLRWRFTGLTKPAAGTSYELLLRTGVTGATPDQPSGECLAELRAVADGRSVILPLDPQSPYGAVQGGVDSGRVVLKHRDNASRDLGQDYLRLRLPADAIAADGSATVQLTRLQGNAVVVVEQQAGMLLAVPAGSMPMNLLRGCLVLLAACGLLTATALLGASLSNLGVALLASLTLWFAGSAHDIVRDTLEWEKPSLLVRRLLELMLQVVPDFHRIPVATELAAGRGLAWAQVGEAWAYYGGFTAIMLGLAWIALVRREL